MKNRILTVVMCVALMFATAMSAWNMIKVPTSILATNNDILGKGQKAIVFTAKSMNAHWANVYDYNEGTTFQGSWVNAGSTNYSFDHTCTYKSDADALHITAKSNREAYGRIRFSLGSFYKAWSGGSLMNTSTYNAVSIMYSNATGKAPSSMTLQVFSHTSDPSAEEAGKITGTSGTLTLDTDSTREITKVNMAFSLSGYLDFLLMDFVGEIYLYAIMIYNSSSTSATYYSYFENTLVKEHGVYRLRYNYNGNGTDTTTASRKYVYNGDHAYSITLSSTKPTWSGYTFGGWTVSFGSGQSTQTVQAGKSFSFNLATAAGADTLITAKARWLYTITYNGNGSTDGSMSTSNHYYNTSSKLTANAFTKTGYTFNGWNTNKGGTGTSYDDEASIKTLKTQTLYAQWTPITYTVKYYGNGHTSVVSSEDTTSHTYDVERALRTKIFNKRGYSFLGWNTQADGSGTSYASGATVKNLTSTDGATVNLYAQWSVNTYTISFDGNGGTTPDSMDYTVDDTKTLPSSSLTGYNFLGWKPSADAGTWKNASTYPAGTSVNDKIGSPSMVAQWQANTYTVTFDPTAGSVATTSKIVTYDSTYEDLPVPTAPAGYTFAGWYTAAEGGSKIASDSTVSTASNHTLYARWEANSNTITYITGTNESTVDVTTYTTGKTAKISSTVPTRTGYTFAGWTVTEAGTNWPNVTTYNPGDDVTSESEMYGNVTLIAQWTPHTYTVVYDANTTDTNLTGSTAGSEHSYGTDKALTDNGFERPAYAFAGWNTAADGTGTSYNDGVEVKNLTAENGGTVTLYAQWTPIEYTVILLPNEGALGDGVADTIDYNVEGGFTLPEPTRVGHTFDGWKVTAMAADGNWVADKLYTSDELTITAGQYGNIRLTAQWTANTYGITYDEAEGKLPDDAEDSYTYGTATTLPTPVRGGYRFEGWMVTELGQDASGWVLNETYTAVPSGAMGEVELTAQWLWSGISVYYAMDNSVGTLTSYADQMNDVDNMVVTTEGSVVKFLKEGYVFGGWYIDPTYTTPVDPTWVDEYGRLKVDLRDTDPSRWLTSYTFYAKAAYETQTITLSAQCTENPAQTFIYKITGTPVLAVLGPICLEFTLLQGNSLELKLPVGDYIITEYTDWSWRYPVTEEDDEDTTVEDVERDVAIVSRYDTFIELLDYGTPTNTLWLNSYSLAVTSYPGKDPEFS